MSAVLEREPPSLPGLTFIDRLGTGGYAEVFLYEQSNTRLRVAVKVLFPEQVSDRSLQQFEAEAKAMAELADHPYIVQVFQADVTPDGRPYLVMKYYPNRNLAVRAKAERISVPEVLRIGVQISCAVETAHRAGILHRDIKPANILTSHYGQPGLTDFGIATRTGGVEEESEGLSIPWSAPEVVFATSSGNRTSDIYSLGATLWHLLAGRSPFEVPGGDNSQPALMRRIRETPVPKTGRPDVPPSLERVLAQAMSKQPSDRPQTALDLARSLQAVETEQRWAATPLVIIEEEGPPGETPEAMPGAAGEEDDGFETRQRRPQSVVAQPPAPERSARPPVLPPADDPETVRRVVPVAPAPVSAVPGLAPREHPASAAPIDEPRTVRRPTTVLPPVEESPSPVATGPRSKRRLLVAATVAIVGGSVGAAVALSGGGAKASPRTTVTGPPPTLALAVPNSPAVTGSRTDADHVTFTWTEAGAGAGYRYYYQEPGSSPQAVAGNSVTLPAAAGQKVCITVQVTADDGTESASSQLSCAG